MRTRLIAATVLLASGTAAAWVARPDREPTEVAAIGAPRSERSLVAARDLPDSWQGARDRDTGVLAELWGGYVPAPGAVADAALAETAARAFLAAHLAKLAPGSALADFVTVSNVEDAGLRTVAFAQHHRGVPVVGGSIAVMIKRDRVFAAASQAIPNLALAVPPRTGAVDVRRTLDWLGGRLAVRSIGARVVLPLAGEVRVADHVVIEALDRPGRWDVYVASDGAPILRSSQLRFATGTLTYDVGVRYPLGTRHDAPASEVGITADTITTTTGTDGTFSWSGTAVAAVVTGLSGPRVAILNEAGALATANLSAQPGGTARWSLAADEYGDAQVSAFVFASAAKVRARQIVPALATYFDAVLQVTVNEDDICNAYSTGDDIHFFRKGPMCENSGRLVDVVSHEFGHSLHRQSVIPGVGGFTSALSEGLADYFAATIVEDPGLGRGFLFDNRAVRDLDPMGSEAIWPRDKSGDPHVTGLIIGGTLWDLRKRLIKDLGATAGRAQADVVFAGILRRAPDIPGAYLAARTADDDDGDLGNGTPHGCALEAAFGKHGLAGSTFVTTQVNPPVITGSSFSIGVTIPQTPCPSPQVSGVKLTYRIGAGAPASVDFAPTGATWMGTLPALPEHQVVNYTITVTLDDDSTVTFPENPADPEYTLFTGTPTEIWCERFDADPMWMKTGADDWQWGVPAPISLAGDATTTHAGTSVLGTDLANDGRYASNTMSSITTPAIDASMFDQVHLQYWRWLTVEDAIYDKATIAVNGTNVWTNKESSSGGADHVDREWRFQDVDVTQFAANPIQVTWALQTDMSRELGGWTLDEVCLVGIGKHAVCGDGIVDDTEQCDFGDTKNDDGCSSTCQREDADLGGCCSTGSNPAGPLVLSLGVLVGLARRRRLYRHLPRT